MKLKIALLLIIGLVLILAAYSRPRPRTFDLVGKDFRFTPSTLQVREGDIVRINFSNPDVIPHLIDLPDFNQHIALAPGGEFTLEFRADKIGTFPFVCSVPGHQEAGMLGELIVVPNQ